MKGFILSVFVLAAALGAFVLMRHDYRTRQCRSAGFDGLRNGECVYRSRYGTLDYVTSPDRAADWMLKVKDFEETERRHRR